MTNISLHRSPTTHIPADNVFYNNSTLLLGHRGARGERVENSKQGFEHVATLSKKSGGKLVGIEFDIQLTQDGTLVIFHDDNLLRLYGRQSRIDQLSYTEIQKLTQHTTPIIRLIDILPVLKDYKHVELEVKTHNRTNHHNLINALSDALKSFNDRLNKDLQDKNLQDIVTLTSFDLTFHHLAKTHTFLSTFRRGLLVEPYYQTLADYKTTASQAQASTFDTNIKNAKQLYDIPYIAQRLLCTRIGLFYPMYDKYFMTLCKRLDIKTSAWTVNEILDAKNLIMLGVDHIITDYPSMMLGIK